MSERTYTYLESADLTELFQKCALAARVTARKFNAVEADDLTQELFLHAWKQYKKAQPDDWDRWLNTVSFNTATGMHEKIMRCKFVQYEYTPEVVRKILESAFFYDTWDDAEIPMSAQSPPRGTKATYDEIVQMDIMQGTPDPTDARDMCLDVTTCMDLLTPEDKNRVISRYRDGVMPKRNSSEMKALYRAVDRLTEQLNSYRGQARKTATTGRRAVTNAHAEAIIKRTWES